MGLQYFKVSIYPQPIIPMDVLDRMHTMLAHHGFTFVQPGLDFVKDSTTEPSLSVLLPCLFHMPSLTVQRK